MSPGPHQIRYVHEISVDSHGRGIKWSVLNPLWSPTVEHFVLWYCISYIQTGVEKFSLWPPDESTTAWKKDQHCHGKIKAELKFPSNYEPANHCQEGGIQKSLTFTINFTQRKPDKLTGASKKKKNAIIFINQE